MRRYDTRAYLSCAGYAPHHRSAVSSLSTGVPIFQAAPEMSARPRGRSRSSSRASSRPPRCWPWSPPARMRKMATRPPGMLSLAKHAMPAMWWRPSSRNRDLLLLDRPSGISPILTARPRWLYECFLRRPEDAEPDPHAGRNRKCQRLHSQPSRSAAFSDRSRMARPRFRWPGPSYFAAIIPYRF